MKVLQGIFNIYTKYSYKWLYDPKLKVIIPFKYKKNKKQSITHKNNIKKDKIDFSKIGFPWE